MTPHGSLQIRLYRIARRDMLSFADAVRLSGVLPREAEFIDRDDAREQPEEECHRIPARWAERAVGGLAGTPLGQAAVVRLSGALR